jgi:hypothetical protein
MLNGSSFGGKEFLYVKITLLGLILSLKVSSNEAVAKEREV